MEQRFFADTMLGKLARWLRVVGCDVAYVPALDDAELVARAREEGRLILTRDTLLIRRRWAREHHFFIVGDHWRDQLRQVVTAFGIDPFRHILTRCLECNEPLRDVVMTAVADRVPPYVHETQELFRECPACGRIYWGGTHRERMVAELEKLLGE
ncbi:MAG: hypothetical protein CXR31_02840 [Geobacter sp.]|nr:MAG: hypothetical protein CXR31_02840 [Geobacter sp.]